MIQAHELRIGNLVLLTETTFKDDGSSLVKSDLSIVDGVQIYCESFNNDAVKRIPINAEVYINNKRVGLDQIQPITLTDEWLLKFGFEEQTPKYFVLDLGDFSMRYYYNFSGSTWKFELEDKTLKIKFVHQFQNLYFALTQKELILK